MDQSICADSLYHKNTNLPTHWETSLTYLSIFIVIVVSTFFFLLFLLLLFFPVQMDIELPEDKKQVFLFLCPIMFLE